jgi:hypothetical protein
MLEACAEVATKDGPVAEGLGLQAMDLRSNFEFGMSSDDFGREISIGRERYRVAA